MLRTGLNLDVLHSFVPLNALSRSRLQDVLNGCRIQSLPAGTVLFRCGDPHVQSIFLLSGRLELTERDGEITLLDATDVAANHALAPTNPRQFNATALSNSGTVNWQAGQLRSGSAGSITNHNVWNDTASNALNNDFGGTAWSFINTATGTYHKAGSGTTNFGVPFQNDGTVSATAARRARGKARVRARSARSGVRGECITVRFSLCRRWFVSGERIDPCGLVAACSGVRCVHRGDGTEVPERRNRGNPYSSPSSCCGRARASDAGAQPAGTSTVAAHVASSARPDRPSLRYTRVRFASTVFGLMNSSSPTCRTVRPVAARRATRSSVAVSALVLALRSPMRSRSCRVRSASRSAPKRWNTASAASNDCRAAAFSLKRRWI